MEVFTGLHERREATSQRLDLPADRALFASQLTLQLLDARECLLDFPRRRWSRAHNPNDGGPRLNACRSQATKLLGFEHGRPSG
jgi:hypothetical protein